MFWIAVLFAAPRWISAEDFAKDFYRADKVHRIELTLPDEDWDKLRMQQREFVDSLLTPSAKPFDFFRGSIKIDDQLITDVAIRKKGFLGSVDNDYPSFRIKLDEYVDQSPMGSIKRLTINNNKQDLPLISQYMTYRMFREAGVHAPRVGFATVYANGKHLGLYTLVESIDKAFLKSSFENNDGDLLEGTLADFSPKSLPRMELKSGPHDDPANWRANRLTEVLAAEELDMQQLGEIADLDNFFQFWAVESLLAFWDGYTANQNNFFVYENSQDHKLYFMPWGADAAWTSMAGPFVGFTEKVPSSVYTSSLLPHRLFSLEAGRNRYKETMQNLLAKQWNESALNDEIDRVAALISPYVHSRQSQAAKSQTAMKRFIQTRRKRIERELEQWPVAVKKNPKRGMETEMAGFCKVKFKTGWERKSAAKDDYITIDFTFDGEQRSLHGVAVSIKRPPYQAMGFGPPGRSIPPNIEIIGKADDGTSYTFNVSLHDSDFDRPSTHPFDVRGTMMTSQQFANQAAMGPPAMQWLQGECNLTKVGMKPDAEVEGDFELTIMRLRGGFFDPPQ